MSTTVPAAPGLDPDGGDDDGQGPTEFTSNIDLGDDEDDGTPTTGGASTTTGGGPSSTTATSAGSSTTSASTTSTSTATTASTTTPTTQPTTSTTTPTTTTSTTITTTTSTTQPTATPIRIVSGPTINEVNATSFRFSYRTNDVCGTGSFSVSTLGGTSVGSFSGDNICFGPGHGGFPGLQSSANFRNFNLEPGTTYRVSITVRGTPSDGNRTAGSGSDSTSFQVTTAG